MSQAKELNLFVKNNTKVIVSVIIAEFLIELWESLKKVCGMQQRNKSLPLVVKRDTKNWTLGVCS